MTTTFDLQASNKYDVSKHEIKINTDIESLIKAEVFRKQIRIREFFFDFDRLRKGYVTEDKFRSALSMLNMHMTEKDIKELITRYQCGPDLIQYTGFCDKIDQQFLDQEIAKANLLTTKSVSSITKEEAAIINEALLEIKQKIRTKRILLKQTFQDFDKTKCSHITVSQFSRNLTHLGLLPQPNYFNLLIRKYIDNGNVNEVNYVKFCDDVDNVSEMLETVIKGIKPNEKLSVPEESIVQNEKDLKLMGTLFSSKRLADQNSEITDVIKKIQAQCVMKGIRIQEFFKDFDTLRKGTVTVEQLRRVLCISSIEVNEKDLNLILLTYKIDQLQNGLVEYKRFCDDINLIFTKQNIEKDPQAVVTKYTQDTTLPARRRYIQLSKEEEEKLSELLTLYNKEIQNKRVLIKPHFEDFDVTKQGYISKNQFLRILNQFGLFPNEEALNIILKRYTDKGTLDEVNYYEFCRDVDIPDEGAEISKKYAQSFQNFTKTENKFKPFIYKDKPNDIEDLLAKLRKLTSEHRLRIAEFLKDFDKLRSGNVTREQMRLGLNMCKLPLSDYEFDLLVENFKNQEKSNMVRWKDMVDAIDLVFTQKGLEQLSPIKPVEVPQVDYKYGKREMTEEEKNTAQALLQRFYQFCKATRLDIKQFFQDWDKLGRNKVTTKQFRQVLATVNFPISQQEFDAVSRMYFSENEQEVRYVDFINDTKVYELPFTDSNKQQDFYNSQFDAQYKQKISLDFNVILDEIKNIVKINRLRVDEYFKDYDPLRKGIIPTNKFRGVISQMKIFLDEKQLEILENNYIMKEDPIKLNYDKFVSDVYVVFTIPELEKEPLKKPIPYTKRIFLDPGDVLTQDEEQRLDVLMTRLGEVVRKHKIMFKTHFQDKDKAKSGKVSFPRFRSILDFHKIPLTEEQFTLLCKRFGYQRVEFNYVEFDELLKKYENQEI